MELAHAYDTVNVFRSGGAAKVELNRPERDERLGQAVRRRPAGRDRGASPRDDEVRAVMITGAGAAFSSGADLKDGPDADADGRPDVYTTLTERYHPIILGIREMPKPVVAAVNGAAVGIGCSLALGCDLILAARVRLLPAGVREHRPGARRRLVAVRARRAWASRGRPRWRCSASASRPARRSSGA